MPSDVDFEVHERGKEQDGHNSEDVGTLDFPTNNSGLVPREIEQDQTHYSGGRRIASSSKAILIRCYSEVHLSFCFD